MSKLFVNIGLSLDGYMAPEGMTMEKWDRPEYKNWGAKWGALMRWIFNQQYFRENLKLGPGGETGPVNDMLLNTTERIGANSARFAAGAADASYRLRPWLAPVVRATRSLPLELRDEGAGGRPRRRVLPKDNAHRHGPSARSAFDAD